MKRVFRRKWAVAAAAAVLVFALAAVAAAQTTGTTSTTTATTASTNADDSQAGVGPLFCDLSLGGGPAGGHRGGPGGYAPDSAEAQAWQQYRQQQQEAVLKLIREKMSTADQKTFDNLLNQQKTQQQQLQKAMEALRSTNQQIQTMVQKTLGVTPPATSSTTGTSGTTGT